MRVEDFHYHLPPESIAQRPPERRDGGRLLHLHRESGSVSHHRILDLPRLLPPGCLLVVNNSRVIPARILGRRPSGGQVEVLLLEPISTPEVSDNAWRCMLRSSKTPCQGEEITVGEGGADRPTMRVLTAPEHGRCVVQVTPALIKEYGAMPLPPYIRRSADASDCERYQTVYARHDGSVAAPTAGLHFTEELMQRLRLAEVEIRSLTLHVGPGTFVPVRARQVEDHRMEQERYEVPEETALAIARAKAEGRRVLAVGTTVVRTLETTAGEAGRGRSELFIFPGHNFQAVDGLLTNFHLPGSTLLMLVSALAGRERVLSAYNQAVEQGYRFYSYGDAMLIT